MKVLDTNSFRDAEDYPYAVGLGILDSRLAEDLMFSVSNFPFGNSSFVRLA